MFRAFPLLAFCGGVMAFGGVRADEPTQAQCLEAVERASLLAGVRTPDDPIRRDAESLLRRALGEAGSQEFDECLDLAREAECLLEAVSPSLDSVCKTAR